MTKIQKQFIAATEVPDVVTEVALARQVFVKRLLGSSMDLDDTLDLIAELAGERPTAENRDAITWEVYCNHTSAAFALGVAAGQLMSDDAPSRPRSRPIRACQPTAPRLSPELRGGSTLTRPSCAHKPLNCSSRRASVASHLADRHDGPGQYDASSDRQRRRRSSEPAGRNGCMGV